MTPGVVEGESSAGSGIFQHRNSMWCFLNFEVRMWKKILQCLILHGFGPVSDRGEKYNPSLSLVAVWANLSWEVEDNECREIQANGLPTLASKKSVSLVKQGKLVVSLLSLTIVNSFCGHLEVA
ncbi:hypothetical protein NPIL_583421 [Nephila pilipes]|uniref:Uncharacterized protein n=1 Tax=Nephila pilipes TaxID=299642 RepID=A0A8X6QA41_NEPPI|nr:hypothetical protein NPIL_583421 [Nephila pilipes]